MNWGFIGFGRIAVKFLESLNQVSGETPYALASRSNAGKLKGQFPEMEVYDNYEDLLNNPKIDIVYICTTHNFHKQNVIDALKKGKHVLCEKPLGLTVSEIEEMTVVAQKEQKFLMEGLWSRFLPGYQKVKELVKSGEIGELKVIKSEFAFTDVSHKGRLYNPDLAGGSNFDVNIYNLALVHDFFGEKYNEIKIQARKSPTGTDLSCSSILQYADGNMAQLFSSIEITCENSAWLYGTKGWIKMEQFWMCQRFVIHTQEEERIIDLPYESNGYYHEIMEAVGCINRGQLESQLMTIQDSKELAYMLEDTENLIRKS